MVLFPLILIERHGTFFLFFFYWHILSGGTAQSVATSYAGVKEQNFFLQICSSVLTNLSF